MKDRGTAIAMVAPTVLIVALVFIYPLLLSLWTSLQYKVLSQPHLTRFYGWGNYQWLLREPRFWDAFGRSMVFLVATVAASIALGMLVALLLDHYLPHRRWLKALYPVPMVVTPVVVGIQWRFLLNEQFGVLTWILRVLQLPIGGEWLVTPFGAFFRVILPLTAPGLAAATIFILLLAWNEFLFALVLAGGGTAKTLPAAAAQLIGQREIQWNELCAVSTATIVPLLLFFRFVHKYLLRGMIAGAVK